MKDHKPHPMAAGGVWECAICFLDVILIRRGTRLFWRHK
jgi:hypothetical protein